MLSSTLYLHGRDGKNVRIDCHDLNDGEPVMHIGDVTIFAPREILRDIEWAIHCYLNAESMDAEAAAAELAAIDAAEQSEPVVIGKRPF